MGELEQQIWKAKVTKEVIRLETQVKELQEKCQQPASKLLQVRDGPPPQIREIPQEGTMCCGLEKRERGRKGKWRLFVVGGTDGYQLIFPREVTEMQTPK